MTTTTATSHHSHDDGDAAPDDHAERTSTPAEHGHDGPGRHKLDDQELAALRASVVSVRCGRSRSLMHLSEVDEVFTQRRRHRAPIVLCGTGVADPDHHDDDGHDCPGGADCLRYCPDCVRSAVRWVEQRDGTGPLAGGGTGGAGGA